MRRCSLRQVWSVRGPCRQQCRARAAARAAARAGFHEGEESRLWARMGATGAWLLVKPAVAARPAPPRAPPATGAGAAGRGGGHGPRGGRGGVGARSWGRAEARGKGTTGFIDPTRLRCAPQEAKGWRPWDNSTVKRRQTRVRRGGGAVTLARFGGARRRRGARCGAGGRGRGWKRAGETGAAPKTVGETGAAPGGKQPKMGGRKATPSEGLAARSAAARGSWRAR
jgi:hypothetical protein